MLSQPAAWNAYTYCLNNPLKYIDAYGYTAKDILIGVGMALDDNLNRGFVKWVTGKLFKRVIRENYEDAYDYYMGRVIGDAIVLLVSASGTKMDIMRIVGSIITGAGVRY